MQYIGEIRMFAGNFAPMGWEFCEGQLVPIAWEYEDLFMLIGTTYGGDGETHFRLPDLRGRAPMHFGTAPHGTWSLGESDGAEQVTLTEAQVPAHAHSLYGTDSHADSKSPAGRVFARARGDLYAPTGELTGAGLPVLSAGGGQPHENMQPFLPISFIISLYGYFPSPT